MIQTIKKQLKKNINVLLFDEVESTNNICKEIGYYCGFFCNDI